MRGLFGEMTVMVACRMGSLAVGLLMIPLLLHYLGGDQFAAWALYVAVGLAFSTFESASSNTLVRFVAPSAQGMSSEGISRVVTNLAAILFVAYAVLVPLVVWGAAPLALLIRLPEGAVVSPAGMIVIIYIAAMLRALLLPGQSVLLAGGNLRWFSLSSFGVSVGGNVAAAVAAGFYQRADAVVMASWSVQLVLFASYSVISRRRYSWRFERRAIEVRIIRKMVTHAFQLQLKEWAYFFNYQFDKFLISALTGLWAVGPYEVANRAVQALRSVPVSSLGLLLPEASATVERGGMAIKLYRETTRYAAFGALLFIGVPLAAGWYFLFSWAGEFGYYARWAFPALGLGALTALVAVPAAILLQAEGRPDVEARAAGISVLLNLPLSLLLIPRFGAAGAGFAIGVGTAIGAIWILARFHRLHELSVLDTLVNLWQSIRTPAITVVVVGILEAVSFKVWFTPLLPVTGFSARARMVPAVIACAIGGLCALFVLWEAKRGLMIRDLSFSGPSPGRDEQMIRCESGATSSPDAHEP